MVGPSANEVKKAVTLAFKIPGLYRRDEAAFLYRLARRRGTLVEIGCWMGRTTSILLQAAKPWHARVVTIDPFTPMPNSRDAGSAARWRRNLARVGLEPGALMPCTSDEAAAQWTEPVAMVFIDGDHNYAAVRRDLDNWTRLVKVGGVVALHDMFFPSITGVCQAVAEWWSEARQGTLPAWELVGLHDYTIAFKRMR